jgi:hypothetical protein
LVLSTFYSVILFALETETYFYAINVVIDIIVVMSIIGLLSATRWGTALTILTSGILLMMNMANLQTAWLFWETFEPLELVRVVAISSVGLVLDIIIAIYLFRSIFLANSAR